MKCRHCGTELSLTFLDLGTAPPSNSYLTLATLHEPEQWFPLRVLVCEKCWLVQTEDFAAADDLFTPDYAYFSSYSDTWLAHARQYVQTVIERFALDKDSLVVEVAANDGYLLQYMKNAGVPCLGIEPTAGTAKAARQKGLAIVEEFFGQQLAGDLVESGQSADLIIANNVLAHVPDINDFVSGFATLLKPTGVATFEFPHLSRLVQENQFDTIYHEHYSYLSLMTVSKIFSLNGLQIFDVEKLSTHGGSLRVYAQRSDTILHRQTEQVDRLLNEEKKAGMDHAEFYTSFQENAERIKFDLLAFLLEAKRNGERVAAYGAAAKGNTLLNFSGIKSDLVEFVVDRNPAKLGGYMPGSRIPITTEDYFKKQQPEWVLILPWNLQEEIVAQLFYIRDWKGRFVTAVPKLHVL